MLEPQVFGLEQVDQRADLSSALHYLELGLSRFTQRRTTEGLALLRLARDQLASAQLLPEKLLDALEETTRSYMQAEEMLHEASKRFAAADRDHQALLDRLSAVLQTAQSPTKTYAHIDPSSSRQSLSRSDWTISPQTDPLPSLYITCFERFTVRRFAATGETVELCRNLKGQAILRYLVIQPGHRACMDQLMADLWPEEHTESARHKLQVAISALRCSLNREYVQAAGGGYILCKDRVYQLNPDLELHIDSHDLLALYRQGGQAHSPDETAELYERACKLHNGTFLAEDLYAEWSFPWREELTRAYLTMCGKLARYYLEAGQHEATLIWAQNILTIDRCDEDAYRLLIRAYAASGRRSEALRRYQQCQQVLMEELGVQPMPETQRLLQTILHAN
ncbi:MAG TPA: BTAD domain-containing putative transcriptional regulator [Ktedonobacteraceae bacterium]|nr:BTAD domain-containing putative transcriptional regulator [Ktedonobacteraceae bacterium]